jgi:hypothetical protein
MEFPGSQDRSAGRAVPGFADRNRVAKLALPGEESRDEARPAKYELIVVLVLLALTAALSVLAGYLLWAKV